TIKSKLHEVPAILMSAYIFSFVLFLPSLIALIFSGFFKDLTLNQSTLEGLGFVAILSIFGTGLAMMMNYKLLSISTPLFASTVTLLMPIVAIIWGILDGEKLTMQQSVGALVILAGLIFLRSKPKVV
ncbi:MAG: EamA family transporter, partial [Chryseobacterium sp.]|nr:EamA family transporter [Chryseobacterium sp.]